MPLELSDDDRKALAADVAKELDTGLYGNRAVLSRRQLLTLAGGSAGVAGLVALGVDPATAQSAAGQVGTQSSPEDVYAYNLDVQGALQRELDAGGQAIENVGSVSTEVIDSRNGYDDESDNRSLSTFYQNTTGGDMDLSVCVEATSDSTDLNVIADVAASPTVNNVAKQDLTIDTSEAATLTATVPKDYYYRVNNLGDESIEIKFWAEQY